MKIKKIKIKIEKKYKILCANIEKDILRVF